MSQQAGKIDHYVVESKKLGIMQPDEELDAAIENVCEIMGRSNKHKYRALFYALLAKNFGKTAIYS